MAEMVEAKRNDKGRPLTPEGDYALSKALVLNWWREESM